jgi:hypothetical protein
MKSPYKDCNRHCKGCKHNDECSYDVKEAVEGCDGYCPECGHTDGCKDYRREGYPYCGSRVRYA